MVGAIVGSEVWLGLDSIVNCGAVRCGAVLDHHAQVEDFGHLGVSACMASGTRLGRGV